MQATSGIKGRVQDAVIAQVRTAVEADAQKTLAVGIQKEVEAFQGAGTASFDFDRQALGAQA